MTSVPRAPKRHRNAYLAPSTNVDDEDAITPCPPEMPVPGAPEPCYQHNDRPPRRTPSASSAASSTSSPGCPRRRSPGGRVWRELEGHFDPLDGTDGDADDTARLWRRMLAIQRAFGCYRSARMSAALEAGEDGVVPTRTCLDLLNDSIAELPAADRRALDAFLGRGARCAPRRRSGSPAAWAAALKRRLRHGASAA